MQRLSNSSERLPRVIWSVSNGTSTWAWKVWLQRTALFWSNLYFKVACKLHFFGWTMCPTPWPVWTRCLTSPLYQRAEHSVQNGAALPAYWGRGNESDCSPTPARGAAAQGWGAAKGPFWSSLKLQGMTRTYGIQTSKPWKPSQRPLILDQQESRSRNVGCLNYFLT